MSKGVLWVDKYRPATLDKLDHHADVTEQLKRLATAGDFPHLIVFGPPGAGKKTRINAVLREIFGAGVEKLKIDHKVFETPSGKKMDLNVISSNYHIEMNPSDVGNQDRVVVQEVIKEIAQTQQLDLGSPRSFKVVVIHEAGQLTRDAQAGLRRTMEKYMGNLRIIICCNATSKLIAPIRSRCLLVRVPAPSVEDVCAILDKVAQRERIQLPEAFAKRIAITSDRNLRRALLMLEAAHSQRYPFVDNQPVELADWQKYTHDVAKSIIAEQSPSRLLETRARLYELLVHCIPPTTVLKTLAFELAKLIDSELKSEVLQQAAFYEHRMQQGTKPIFHLEAFVAKFMSIYKQFLLDMSM